MHFSFIFSILCESTRWCRPLPPAWM